MEVVFKALHQQPGEVLQAVMERQLAALRRQENTHLVFDKFALQIFVDDILFGHISSRSGGVNHRINVVTQHPFHGRPSVRGTAVVLWEEERVRGRICNAIEDLVDRRCCFHVARQFSHPVPRLWLEDRVEPDMCVVQRLPAFVGCVSQPDEAGLSSPSPDIASAMHCRSVGPSALNNLGSLSRSACPTQAPPRSS